MQFGSAATSLHAALGVLVGVPGDVLLCAKAMVGAQAAAIAAATRTDFIGYVIF